VDLWLRQCSAQILGSSMRPRLHWDHATGDSCWLILQSEPLIPDTESCCHRVFMVGQAARVEAKN
jgi:hypothetical protein